MIENGKLVTLEYSLYSEEGELLDSSQGLGPLSFVCGTEQLLPALECALIGLNVGESKQVALAAKDAFGPIKPSAFREIELKDLPDDCRLEGTVFGINDDNGEVHQVKVHQIKGDKAVLDFNHPLAGKNIKFDIHVISVE
jgi:FKBP-type peptidyl-prolyl cis-trans isomerase 2